MRDFDEHRTCAIDKNSLAQLAIMSAKKGQANSEVYSLTPQSGVWTKLLALVLTQ